jgi:hypothetical protein
MSNFRNVLQALILALFVQGCMPARPLSDGPQTINEAPTQNSLSSSAATETPLPTPTFVPAATDIPPTLEPDVTITAVNGNIYIRRGPGLPYNLIGVLYKGISAQIIGQDVLSRWVQIQIPDSEKTGWVSIMTDFTRVDGDLASVPDFTFKDWPLPAYVKNCTEHDLVLEPGDIYLFSLWTNAEYLNEVQVNPGVYTAYDLFAAGVPEVQKVDIKEGMTVYLTVNGFGESHKCP